MSEENNVWAVVELMGHARTAGMLRKSDIGNSLIRVDVPVGGDGYHTRYFGEAAIYSISIVSEEIARAYATPDRDIIAYDEPIVPRAEYEKALYSARQNMGQLERQVNELQRRLTAVNALPAGNGYDEDEDDEDDLSGF